jgi:hypothetical protein
VVDTGFDSCLGGFIFCSSFLFCSGGFSWLCNSSSDFSSLIISNLGSIGFISSFGFSLIISSLFA